MRKHVLIYCVGWLTACSGGLNLRTPAYDESPYYPANEVCESALNSSKRFSPTTMRNMGSDCDIITLVESEEEQSGTALTSYTDDLSSLKNKFIRTTEGITHSIAGQDLFERYQSAVVTGEVQNEIEEPNQVVHSLLEDQTADFVSWSEKLDLDRFNAYLEAKIVQSHEAETEKIVDYGFRILASTMPASTFTSPESIMASYLPMASLAIAKWDMELVRSPFLDVLKSGDASQEDVMRISARAYEILQAAQAQGADLASLVDERATRAPKTNDSALTAFLQSQTAFETIRALAEAKSEVAAEIQNVSVGVRDGFQEMGKILDNALASPEFNIVKDALKGHQGFANLESILAGSQLRNAARYRNLLRLADQSYKVMNGDANLDQDKLNQLDKLATAVLIYGDTKTEFNASVQKVYDSYKRFLDYQTEALPAYSSMLMDAFDAEDADEGLGLHKRRWRIKFKKKIKVKLKIKIRKKGNVSVFKMKFKRKEVTKVAVRAVPRLKRVNRKLRKIISKVSSLYGFVHGMAHEQKRNHKEVMSALGNISHGIDALAKGQKEILNQTIELQKGQQQILQGQVAIQKDIWKSAEFVVDEIKKGQVELFKGQEQIVSNMSVLAEGQNQMLQYMGDAFLQVRKEAMIKHQSIIENLSDVHGNINRLGQGVSAILTEDISSCQVLQRSKMNPEDSYVNSQGLFRSHDHFLRFAEKNGSIIGECMKAIQTNFTFADPNFSGNDSRFFPALTKAALTGEYDYSQQYAKTFDFVSRHVDASTDFYSLTFPTDSLVGVDNKMFVQVDEVPDNRFFSQVVASIDPSGNQNIVNPQQLIYLTQQLLNSHIYFELYSPKYEPLSQTQLINDDSSDFNNIGYQKLKHEALPMLQAAIAQRQLLRGDITLSLVKQSLCASSTAEFYELMFTNRLLATNIVNSIANLVTVCGVAVTYFPAEQVYQLRNPDINAPLEKSVILLPRIDLGAEMLPDPITEELKQLTSQVVNEIAGYELSRSLEPAQNEIYKRVILNSSIRESF